MKRPSSSGAAELVLSPTAFLRRLAALIPPPRVNLVRFFGVLAPNARLRPLVVPRQPPPPEPAPNSPAPAASPFRLPWAALLKRTFAVDVLTCLRCPWTSLAAVAGAAPSWRASPLHANTWVHENDRAGVERLCSYGARGPLSLEPTGGWPTG